MTNTYVSIDLETTGLNPKRDKIMEIGALKVVNGQAAGVFATFVNPGRRPGEKAARLTGIRGEDLEGAPEIDRVLPDLLDFLEDLPLLGHHVISDYSFLKKAAVDSGLAFEKEGIDTLKIARKFLASLEHKNLDYLCGYYGIPHRAHRALADAEAASALYHRLAERFYSREEELFVPARLQFKVKRDVPATKHQREGLYRLLERHKITVEADLEKLSRSEASRLTNKILSKYGR